MPVTQVPPHVALTIAGSEPSGGAGMQAVVHAVSKEVNAVLTGYISPIARKYLSTNGIEVLTGIDGTIADVVDE